MPVQIGCAECGKKYRVDDKLLGKKIRCKNCQGVIRVEEAPQPVAAAKAPAPSVKKAAPAKPVRKAPPPARKGPQPEALDLPDIPDLSDLPDLDVPRGRTIQLDDDEIAAAAAPAPACPSCGAPFPAANKVCMECGYNRASGQRAKTQVAKSQATVAYGSHASDRDETGKRIWRAYDSSFLNFLDTAIPRSAMALFIIFSALGIIGAIGNSILMAGKVNALVLLSQIFIQVLSVVLAYTLVLRVTVWGVEIAAKMFKFEVPEDGRSRVLGVQVASAVCGLIAFLAVFLLAGFAASGSGVGRAAMASAFVSSILFGVVVYFAAGWATFKLVFHLRIGESLLGYFLMLAFSILGAIADAFIIFAVAFLLGFAIQTSMSH